MKGKRDAYRMMERNPEGNRPLGRARRRCAKNNEIVLREMV
jgi:hypothetical protein